VSRPNVDSWNRLPSALHRSKRASKNTHRWNVQFVKADPVCRDALNRTPEKVQPSKDAPSLTPSVQSVS
jgi:hypothetical protein